MSTAALSQGIAPASPSLKARMAGVFYLLTFLTGAAAQVLVGRLVVHADAAATAANVLAHASQLRLGFAAYLMVVASYVAVTGLFYLLFRPVNRTLSLIAAFFSLVGCAIQAAACVFLLAPWSLLGGAPYLSAFHPEQLRGLAFLSFTLYGQAFDICLVFFGFYCLLIGVLILRSTFLPRALGVLMALAGLGWLTFLSPPPANPLYPYNMAPGILGEGALTLWLLVAGVNARRWQEQAGLAGE